MTDTPDLALLAIYLGAIVALVTLMLVLSHVLGQRHTAPATLQPFGRLAAFVISARHKETAEAYARAVVRRAPLAETIEVLGPAEAPLAVVRGRHRWRILVKAPREVDLQTYLRAWLAALPDAKGDLRLAVDIDPYNFL